MHGLINRSIQMFLKDTYGTARWESIALGAGVSVAGFEALLIYEDEATDRLLDSAADQLRKPREALLEDLGIYLARLERPRRLLRFGGVDYADFVQTLDDLPERVRMAVPDLDLPDLAVRAAGPGIFIVYCRSRGLKFGSMLVGVLRAMADDFGALALIDLARARSGDSETVTVELLDARHGTERRFDLAQPVVT